MKKVTRVAIVGGGPSALFMFKRFVDLGKSSFYIEVFERKRQLGAGMPYSTEGASSEHITNVSGNEIPELVTPLTNWIKNVPLRELQRFGIDPAEFTEYKVLPRLLFGKYLEAQFKLLKKEAATKGIKSMFRLGVTVTDIIDGPDRNAVEIVCDNEVNLAFDCVIICTGHTWPTIHEGVVAGYFDSPYPPAKLAAMINGNVAIKGSSLTAIDAVRTLARYNGSFSKNANGKVIFTAVEGSENLKIKMHSRSGLLPAVRFHLEDSHLSKESILSREEINNELLRNDGFLSLDYVFEKNFKSSFREKEPEFFDKIKEMTIEEFVDEMMNLRERISPFDLLKAEYTEAEKSIRRKKSIYWKEMLASLSFAMNYPAKYFSAEDMLRLQKVLMPLISVVIAFVPQTSVEELLALYQAGVLDIIAVGDDNFAEPSEDGGAVIHFKNEDDVLQSIYYPWYIDCTGQRHLSMDQLPYRSLVEKKTVSPAKLKFKETVAAQDESIKGNKNISKDLWGNYHLRVPGVAINDSFQVMDEYGRANSGIFLLAVPFIGGFNPDYSGLDFCEEASARVIERIAADRDIV